MSIWFKNYTIKDIQTKGTMVEHLGIKVTELGEDFVVGTMPVDNRTKQPFGILHGGASVALAETLASYGGYLTIDSEKYYVVGVEINANHLKVAKSGIVTGKCSPIKRGRSTQVWQTEITDESGDLICVSRITLMVLDRR
ncbi:MAG: hotdog fold thioesterase [Dehalococcoidia bacterium]|jgi:1,4-dihydroxy-2-naphthoyl-CoA hydrolase|nr:hotdog fold thioesterase [Dehalococcoidia bacterium]|tara:strand:+ start:81 stop:500 length:420 start_codon:yes stop_codon:yes gene_type:complete